MTDTLRTRIATTSYGRIPIPPWKVKKMAAIHRRFGHHRYRLFRYEMEVAQAKRDLRSMLAQMRSLRSRVDGR